MLKTNSKQARQNVQAYIMQGFTGENYSIETPETFKDTAAVIMKIFNSEKPAEGAYSRMNEQERFTDWAQGLPSILDTCYYYNRSAVDDLGAILEETAEEKARYSEQNAEQLLTALIYRELVRGCK
jgi:hypothetical protein